MQNGKKRVTDEKSRPVVKAELEKERRRLVRVKEREKRDYNCHYQIYQPRYFSNNDRSS